MLYANSNTSLDSRQQLLLLSPGLIHGLYRFNQETSWVGYSKSTPGPLIVDDNESQLRFHVCSQTKGRIIGIVGGWRSRPCGESGAAEGLLCQLNRTK